MDSGKELRDGKVDIYSLFFHYNALYFDEALGPCVVSWTDSHLNCTGTCHYYPDGSCEILLSELLFKSRPTADLKNALLHEMIHAFLCIKNKKNDHSEHGPSFRAMMDSINASSVSDPQRPSGGYNITIYHKFQEEADSCRASHWICESCGNLIKSGKKKEPSATECIENAGPEGRCDNPSCQWQSNKKLRSASYVRIQEPTERDKNKMSLQDDPEFHVGRYKGLHYMTRQRKRELCDAGTKDNLDGKKVICEAGAKDSQDGRTKVAFKDVAADHLDGRKGTFKDGGTQDHLDGKVVAISDLFPPVGAPAGNFDKLKSFELTTWSRAVAPAISKRARTPTIRKHQASTCQKRRKLGRRKNDDTVKSDYTVASEWLEYFAYEESEEDVEPLVNKRTERRKRQKQPRNLNGGSSIVVGNEQQHEKIQAHEVGIDTRTGRTIVEIPDD